MISQSLIKSCLQNDRVGYKELYKLTLPWVINLCRKYNVHDSDMEDVIQEIYSNIFISLNKYQISKGSFKAWFIKLAINTIFKSFRSKKIKIVSIDSIERPYESSEEKVEDIQILNIASLVNELPLGYKTVFNLSIDGLDHGEISEYLGISKSASRSQLARAKQMLRKKLKALKTKIS